MRSNKQKLRKNNIFFFFIAVIHCLLSFMFMTFFCEKSAQTQQKPLNDTRCWPQHHQVKKVHFSCLFTHNILSALAKSVQYAIFPGLFLSALDSFRLLKFLCDMPARKKHCLRANECGWFINISLKNANSCSANQQ